ncbi:MAG: hypothetical protein ACRELA_08480 [Candidatus Rokuibacteriota bacterium]
MPIDTVFLCFQLRSLDPARFMEPVSRQLRPAGVLPETRMAEVDRALRLVLDL